LVYFFIELNYLLNLIHYFFSSFLIVIFLVILGSIIFLNRKDLLMITSLIYFNWNVI